MKFFFVLKPKDFWKFIEGSLVFGISLNKKTVRQINYGFYGVLPNAFPAVLP